MTARAAALRSTLGLALRLDLRLLLAVAAIAIGVIAAAPQGASAQPNTGGGTGTTRGQRDCEAAGGTWTVEGSTAFCKGLGGDKDYSCNLKINPKGTACSHLPRGNAAARTSQGGGTTSPIPTPMPTFPKDAAAGAATAMSPLDE